MKKLLLSLALLVLTPAAHAREYSAAEILSALQETPHLQLVDENGQPMTGLDHLLALAAQAKLAGSDDFAGACEEMEAGPTQLGCGLQITGPQRFFLTFQANQGTRGKLKILGPVNFTKAN